MSACKFSKTTKCTNLLVLIYSKLHSKSCMWLPILTPAKAVYNVCRLPLVQKVACKLNLWWLYFLKKKNSRTSINYLLRIIPLLFSFSPSFISKRWRWSAVCSRKTYQWRFNLRRREYACDYSFFLLLFFFFLFKGIIKQDVWGKTSSEDS